MCKQMGRGYCLGPRGTLSTQGGSWGRGLWGPDQQASVQQALTRTCAHPCHTRASAHTPGDMHGHTYSCERTHTNACVHLCRHTPACRRVNMHSHAGTRLHTRICSCTRVRSCAHRELLSPAPRGSALTTLYGPGGSSCNNASPGREVARRGLWAATEAPAPGSAGSRSRDPV